MFEAIKWGWVGPFNLDLCFITALVLGWGSWVCSPNWNNGGRELRKNGPFYSVTLDQTAIVDLQTCTYMCVCWLFSIIIIVFCSGRWGIQSNLIVLSGTTGGAGIRGSTAAAASAERGPTAVARRASTINPVAFQKGITLWTEQCKCFLPWLK